MEKTYPLQFIVFPRGIQMRMDKLTAKFQLALADAQSLAVGRDHQFIAPVHVLLAMMQQDGGTVRGLLAQSGGNLNRLRTALGEAIERLPQVQGAAGDVHLGKDTARLLNVTDKHAQSRGDQFLSSELFVLATTEDQGAAGQALASAGGTQAAVEKAINDIRGGETVDDANAEEQRQALDKYTIDLTERALQGKIDPIIGRDEEIRRAMQEIGLTVNRLIRISYGPFQLGELIQGEVEEVRRKVVRDQLGLDAADERNKAQMPARGKGSGRPAVRRAARRKTTQARRK